MEDEIMELLSTMLGGAFRQGMASQRISDAQIAHDAETTVVGESLIKFKELMNFGEEKQETQ